MAPFKVKASTSIMYSKSDCVSLLFFRSKVNKAPSLSGILVNTVLSDFTSGLNTLFVASPNTSPPAPTTVASNPVSLK